MSEQPTTPSPAPSADMSLSERLRLYAGIAVAIVFVIFFFQNLHEVKLNFLWMDWTTNLFWALLLSAIFGSLVTLAFGALQSRAARRKAKTQAAQQQKDAS